MTDDFFAMLDAEIAVATKATKLKADRDAAKRRANNMQSPQALRAKAKSEFQMLDAQLSVQEWTSTATVALFQEQQCDGCGSSHLTFLQYMVEQELIRKPSTKRWVRATKPEPDLPRESLVQPMLTHICSHCCEDHGFALLTAKKLKPRRDAVSASNTYAQEDINAPSA